MEKKIYIAPKSEAYSLQAESMLAASLNVYEKDASSGYEVLTNKREGFGSSSIWENDMED